MKINDVIQKCIKIPGISIKQAEYSMELILNTKEGKGSMTFFSLFPGLSLAYIFINSFQPGRLPTFDQTAPLQKVHCFLTIV